MKMATLGFTRVDFEVFKVDGFDERMQQIHAYVRPKLLKLGDVIAPELGRRLRVQFFQHVVKHARGTVNPPPESWAAFGPSPRGYKRHAYLALCISGAGLHARVVVKAEADNRLSMARRLKQQAAQLTDDFTGTPLARYDKWDFARLPEGQRVARELIDIVAENVAKKRGGLDLGFGWNPKESLRLDPAELLDAFRELAPLYRILSTTP